MLSIGPLHFSSPFVLAPLAGYSDLPFRLLCRRFGAGYCVSEMISSHGLRYGQEKTAAMLNSTESERPVAMQLFGADPEIMAAAAALVARHPVDMIDINMGCPVKKVTKKGAGAALMAKPKLAEQIIKAVVAATSLPVTVKFRAGVDNGLRNCVSFAQMAEDAGASAVVVHGRTWAQAFGGVASREAIALVKESVSVPVIGNGDVTSYQDGLAMMAETGCDGVMVGRGALGNPWVFSPQGRPGSLASVAQVALQHAELMERYLPVERMLGCLKNQLGRYFRELPGSAGLRRAVYEAGDFTALKQLFAQCSVVPIF